MKKEIDENLVIKVYVLIDPRNYIVRYVGITSRNLNDRLGEHLYEAKPEGKNKKNHRCNWIRQLLNENLTPIIEQIDETVYSKFIEKEKYWISYYGRENLVNGTDGGEGAFGWHPSQEQRKNASEKLKGKQAWNKGIPMKEESKKKLSKSNMGKNAWNKGLKMGKDFIDKVSKALQGRIAHNKGIPISEEHKNKLRGKKRTEESKQRMSESQKGKEAKNKGKILNVERASKYIGVYWHSQSNKWRTRIVVNNERIHLSQLESEDDSAKAYDIGVLFFYKDKYDLNFPQLKEFYISYLQRYEILDIKELRKVIKNFITERSN